MPDYASTNGSKLKALTPQNVVIWACVAVFVATLIVSFLHFILNIKIINSSYQDRIFVAAILPILGAGISLFKNQFVLSPQQRGTEIQQSNDERVQGNAKPMRARKIVAVGATVVTILFGSLGAGEFWSIILVHPYDVMAIVSRQIPIDENNGHCANSRRFSEIVTASAGWEITVETIHPNLSTSQKSIFNGIIDPTSEAFKVEGVVINNGVCFGPSKDGRGSVRGSVYFEERHPLIPEIDLFDFLSGNHELARAVVPVDGYNPRVEIRYKDGTIVGLGAGDRSGGFSVFLNSDDRMLSVNKS